jgi:hypothetical protein
MKLRMLKEIAWNIGYLFSLSFWRTVWTDPTLAKSLALLVLFTGCADILQIILVPGYPGSEAAE